MTPARVSIGLSCFNAKKWLGLAIRSVFAQSCTDWELIIIDDGSTDGSLEMFASITDPRVRVVADGTNRGLACRLNEIADHARSDLLFRFDADDAMHPERLSRQLEFLDRHEEVEVVGSGAYVIDAHDRVYGTQSLEPLSTGPQNFLRNGFFLHPTVAGRTEWFRANPYDTMLSRSQDKELWLRTHSTTNFAKILEPLLFYREAGTFDGRKYATQKRLDRQILKRYGPSLVGARRTARALATVTAKMAIYRTLDSIGAADALARRRSSEISDLERDSAQSILDRIICTPVPGLDEVCQEGAT